MITCQWSFYVPREEYRLTIGNRSYALLRAISGQEHNLRPETWDALIPYFLKNVSPAGRATLSQQLSAQSTNQSFSMGAGEMEELTLQFLASFANSPSWRHTISLVNEHHQTLAHMAVLFRYTTLLDKVAEWGIDVDAQDVNGFTALHCAYLCGDLDSVGILMGYGADEDIRDNIGRRPLDVYIQRTNAQNQGSPSSDPTSDGWEKISQSGSVGDHNSANLPANRHQQPHTRESTTSPWVLPPPILPRSGNSYSEDDGTLIDALGELTLSTSPIGFEGSPSSTHFPPIPVDQSSPGSCFPAAAHQSVPVQPPERIYSYHIPPSPNPTSRLSPSEAGAPPSRGLEATGTRGIQSDNGSRSPPPLPVPSIQMPVPSPAQNDVAVYLSSSPLSPQAAHSSASASYHNINPGTRAELDTPSVTRPLSTGPPTTKVFAPPSHPPPAPSGSDFTAAHSPVFSDPKPPVYEGGPQRFNEDKKRPLGDGVHEPEEIKTDAVRSGLGKGKQPYVVPVELGKLAEELAMDGMQQNEKVRLAIQPGDPLRQLRSGNA